MKVRAVSGITLALLLIGMLTLAFNIQPVKSDWYGTIIIKADGSVEPSTANITSADNITYTFTGNVNDAIVVERNNIVVDGAGYILQGTGAEDSKGIFLYGRSNVTIRNIEIKAFGYSIFLYGSSNNTVSGNNTVRNNLIENNRVGIWLEHSGNNIISGNSIINNKIYGICLETSSNNTFLHNNFIDNTQEVYSEDSKNIWDGGYPSGGNYWSDHEFIDEFSGPNQDELEPDRICDTPYIIDENNQDNYPLMWVWFPGDLDGDGDCDKFDLGYFAEAYGSKEGDDKYNPLADFTGNTLSSLPDGNVDKFDLSIFANNYRKSCGIQQADSTSKETTIFFDKSAYYPDVNVFWNRSASLLPIKISVVDFRQNYSSFVEVEIFSSIHAKNVTLAKIAPGRFEGSTQVNCLICNEPISDGKVLNARYGDIIIAEYANLSATAFVFFPEYVMKKFFDDPYCYNLLDSDGVPLIDYGPPIGIQYNPVAVCSYALSNYYEYRITQNSAVRERFLVQANWLVRNAEKKGNFSVWEYKFDWPNYNCTAPWVSAMAQGMGLSVLTRAYTLTGNITYLDIAQTAMRSFEVEMTLGGVRYTDSTGVWYEEYADTDTISSKVLNGFIFALFGLFEYSFGANNSEAFNLFCEGTCTLSLNLYRYDTGSWSYYNLQYKIAGLSYHCLHVQQLMTLYKITGNQTFQEYSDLFNSYIQ